MNRPQNQSFTTPMQRLCLFLAFLAACSEPVIVGFDRAVIDRLRPLHSALAPAQPGDWLTEHDEPGQSFGEYRSCNPVLPRGVRGKLYVLPIGEFADAQQRVLDDTIEYLSLCYGMPVIVREALPLSAIPPGARRVHPEWGVKQLFTGYILDEVLKPTLPEDAAAYLALTTVDLWPGQGWNFVFGQASIQSRVGIWSVNRNGDPNESDEAYRLCLLRSLKTACHETGHMFSIRHCTAYACLMCGSNGREESDAHPLWMCPECLAKVLWATGEDLNERFLKLQHFCASRGLTSEAAFFRRSLLGTEPGSLSKH